MNETIWSNVAPTGRSYTEHVKGADTKTEPRTFVQTVTDLGVGPIRCNPSVEFLFRMCELGYSVDTGLEDGVAVINGNKLRVTGLFA